MEIKTITGKAEKLRITGEGDKKRWAAVINGLWISGFGDSPIKEGQEVKDLKYVDNEKEYTDPETGEKTTKVYHNYYSPSKTAEKTAEVVSSKIEPKFDELVKVLSMPKITVSLERTVQVNQFEPKKISIWISNPINKVEKSTIEGFLDMAESIINDRMKDVKKESNSEPEPVQRTESSMVDQFMDDGK